MNWKRVALLVAGSLLTVVLLGVGVLTFLVLRLDVRGEIERNVEAATGRDLTINGSVGVSYWPVLGLKAQDVTLANVAGGRAPSFIAADEIDMRVELQPLLHREVNVRRLVFQRPRVALEVDANGQPNWLLRPPVSTTAPTTPPPPSQNPVDASRTSLRSVRINDGEISFFDARQGAGLVAGEVDIATALTSLDAPMRAQGTVRYNDREIKLDASIARPGAAVRGELTQLVANVESDLLTAEFRGQTVATSGELAGTVRASGPELASTRVLDGHAIAERRWLRAIRGDRPAHHRRRRLHVLERGLCCRPGARTRRFRAHGIARQALSQRPHRTLRFRLKSLSSGQAPPPAPEGQTEVAAAMPDAGQAPQPTAQIATVEAAPRAVDIRAGAERSADRFFRFESVQRRP